jgi:leucine dehydrogenase
LESFFIQWDGEDTIIRFDRPTGAWIIIAIHSTKLGPAAGGTRMRSYQDLSSAVRDAHNLSSGMTYKFALANFPRGGGKAVIAVPDKLNPNDRPDLLRRYGKLIKQLGGLYQTGPDVGTSSFDMDIIAETGFPYVFGRSVEKGGAGGTGPATALGVFSAIKAVCEHLFGSESIKEKRVLVQGAGSVGGALIDLLLESDAKVVFSDTDRSIIEHYNKLELEFVPPEKVFDTACDIFSPCAFGGILNRETIPRLKCLAVAGAANNQLAEPLDAERLMERNILYAPDYAINIGGAMCLEGIEAMGWSRQETEERIKSVRHTVRRIFELSKAEGITTDLVARRIAESRLSLSF